MALYKNSQALVVSSHAAFDSANAPGVATPHSGIYRCLGCGDEVASNKGNPLPTQNHSQHAPNQGSIRWRLIVAAETR